MVAAVAIVEVLGAIGWPTATTAATTAVAAPGRPTGQVAGALAGEAGSRSYRPPTTGAVLDPFRPPPSPWLPGNRGIEYATEPGSALVAIGPGVVAFAGPVAGRLVISIEHPDGLRSALTGVRTIEVEVGAVVLAGEPIASALDRVHLGVRRGDAYLDPASLWGRQAAGGRAVLVPVDDPPGPAPAAGEGRAPAEVGRAPSWPSLMARWPW
jgi:murein DD-endopeptidase MepM/ murein hydrolase activator NlpD